MVLRNWLRAIRRREPTFCVKRPAVSVLTVPLPAMSAMSKPR